MSRPQAKRKEPKLRIVYDATLRRPGCVLLQVAMGGTVPDFLERFISASWLVELMPDMHLYEVTPEQLDQLEAISNRRPYAR